MHTFDLGSQEVITALELVEIVGKPDPVILDVGCNDGEHTQLFLDLFPKAKVYGFEPDPRARRRFSVVDARAQLFATAVGAVDGVVPFYQSDGHPVEPQGHWDLSGSIKRPKKHLEVHPWCVFEKQIEVPVIRLDTWSGGYEVSRIDFIWADVQGAEGDLVRGGCDTLKNTRYFYTEFSDQELYEGQPTLSQLRSMLPNFVVERVYTDDVLFRNTEI